MLEVTNLHCGYDGNEVIKGVSFKVEDGENLSIVGPNGCGKTTLLRAIANLIDYEGCVKIDNEEVKHIKRRGLAKKVALMTQTSQLYFNYTVFETVALGRYAYSNGAFSNLSKDDYKKVLNSIETVGLIDYKDKSINELSGGQLQRVYLARAFAQEPDILLLDEPTNHLDLKYQIEILTYVNKWIEENNKIAIGVLHDLNLVQMFSKNILMLSNGTINSIGDSKYVLEREKLKAVYGIDIKQFMIESLEKWK